ncbi:MAG: alpha/beta fold hydrolase [Acidimicrobiia bacterium]|nr:alpha/beta fold hydrolase [Acidimicrobiia bacterium]
MPATATQTTSAWAGRVQPRVHIAGDGPPLVFLHGAGGLTWDPFLDALAKNFTVYAPEHPGTTPGDPDGVNSIDNLWDLVLYYYELFDSLGLESPAVVGHSFGGMVAAESPPPEPSRVSRLTLISPIGLWRDDTPIPNWMTLTPEELTPLVCADPQGPVAQQMFALPEDPDAAADATIQFVWSMACTGKFVWPIPDKGLRKRIHRITAPTLIIWGHRDGLVSPIYAEEFRSRIAGSRVEVLEDAAHLPQLERMEEAVRLVTEFCSS